VQIISLETTTRNTLSNVKKSFLSKSKKTKSKHNDGKRSVGLKSSMLKRRMSKKAMSAKTSVKKLGFKARKGKMSVKFASKKKKDHFKSLEFNLKNRSSKKKVRRASKKGYITPCKPTVKKIAEEIDVDMDDGKSYLGHTAQSKNRVMSRLAAQEKPKIVKKIKKGPTGKKKLVEPKSFSLRSLARCEERKRLRIARENKRAERELIRK
jgi:hypothetical protein